MHIENIESEYTLRVSTQTLILINKALLIASQAASNPATMAELREFKELNLRFLEQRKQALAGQQKSVEDALKKIEASETRGKEFV